MIATTDNSAASILGRAIQPQAGTLPMPAARFILSLDLPEADRQRLTHLAAKSGAGSLTPEEEQEIENFRNVGRMLDLLKSKARLSLEHAGTAQEP